MANLNGSNAFDKDKNRFINWIHSSLEKKFGKKIAYGLFATVFVSVIAFVVYQNLISLKADQVQIDDGESRKKAQAQTPEPSPTPDKREELDVKGLDNLKNPCNGDKVQFYQLDDVPGKERAEILDIEDPNLVTASSSATYQVAKKFSPPCKIPLIASFSFTPLKAESIGVFLEFENIFRVVIGDGDRKNWKIEKGSPDRKVNWQDVERKSLTNGNISLNKEATVKIEVKRIAESLNITIWVHYFPEGKNGYIDEFQTINLPVKDYDLINNPARPFRLGINDSRYKGNGSLVRFSFMSITQM